MTDLGDFMTAVKKYVDELILLGEAKARFNEAAQQAGIKNIHLVETFVDGVAKAHELAKAPQVVLLSPACSSYDMFNNYPERGRKFKELVKAL